MSKFDTRWEGKRGPSLGAKIKKAIRPPDPLKPRIISVTKRIEKQIQSLGQLSGRFSERDKSIFNQIVDSHIKHDGSHANILASELAEIRKMEKMTLHARMGLEKVDLRLRTITELGDMAVTLTPVVEVVRGIRDGMATVSPQADRELGEIKNILSETVMDAGQLTGTPLDLGMVSDDSKRILNEAAVVAEQRMKEKFPELSTSAAGNALDRV